MIEKEVAGSMHANRMVHKPLVFPDTSSLNRFLHHVSKGGSSSCRQE